MSNLHAGIPDVETRLLRPLALAEVDLAASLLRLASANLRTRIPDLDTRMETEESFRLRVVNVEANAVKRVLENPSGMTQEAIGPFSGSRTVVGDGSLTFTDEELADLGIRSGRAFTIKPHLDPFVGYTVPPELEGWIY